MPASRAGCARPGRGRVRRGHGRAHPARAAGARAARSARTPPATSTCGTLRADGGPGGLNKYNGFWSHTLLGGYGFAGGQDPTLGYLVSARGRHRRRRGRDLPGRARPRCGPPPARRRRRARRDGRCGGERPATAATERARPWTGDRQRPLTAIPGPGRSATPGGTPDWLLQAELGHVPVRVHRQAQEGLVRREDPRRRRRAAAAGDVQRGHRGSRRAAAAPRPPGEAGRPARSCWSRSGWCTTSPCCWPPTPRRLVLAARLAAAVRRSSSSGSGCSCRSSPASWCCPRRCRSSPPGTSCCTLWTWHGQPRGLHRCRG